MSTFNRIINQFNDPIFLIIYTVAVFASEYIARNSRQTELQNLCSSQTKTSYLYRIVLGLGVILDGIRLMGLGWCGNW